MSRRTAIRLKIASPCKVDWSSMTGDDAVRHCGTCKKDVYNLSEMTTAQVESLLSRGGETPCVRFYQRRDGTVMTGDCPVGAKKARRTRTFAGLGAGALAALGVALAPLATPASADRDSDPEPLMGAVPEVVETADPDRGATPETPVVEDDAHLGRAVMGEPMMPPDLER